MVPCYLVYRLANRLLSGLGLHIPAAIQCMYRPFKGRVSVFTKMCAPTFNVCGKYDCYEADVLKAEVKWKYRCFGQEVTCAINRKWNRTAR